MFDRRFTSWDNMLGMYYNPVEGRFAAAWLIPEAHLKFDDEAGVDWLFDSGNIFIYDVGALRNESP